MITSITPTKIEVVVEGKSATLYGEFLLRDFGLGGPDFQIDGNSLGTWADGSPASLSDALAIRAEVEAYAESAGIEISLGRLSAVPAELDLASRQARSGKQHRG